MSSDITKDRDIAENGRESLPLEKEDKAPLREKIVRNLFAKAKEENLGLKLTDMWQRAVSDRKEWINRQQDYLQDYDEFLEVEPQGAFESSSNLHIPMPLWVCRTYHARFMQTILDPEPSLNVKSRRAAFSQSAADVQDLMMYALTSWSNKYQGVDEPIDEWLWSWITSGIGYIKWRWDVEISKYSDVIETPISKPSIYEAGPDGNEIEIPQFEIREDEQVVVKKKFEGPCLEFVPFEDVVTVGGSLANLDTAEAVFHRQWMTSSEMLLLVDRGIFDKAAVEVVMKSGEDLKSAAADGDIKQQRSFNAGNASLDKEYDAEKYEILEVYLKYPIDNTGINSDLIVWVHADSKEILRTTYLSRINPDCEIPLFSILFHKRSGQNENMPIGLLEILHPISVELDAMHNMRVDFGLLSSVPFGFYRSGSSLDPKELKIEPGKLFPVDDPRADVYFPEMSNRAIFGMNEEAALYTLVERITGISDLSLGAISGKQGATRTATGVRGVLNEVNTNLDVPLKRLNRGWKKALKYLLSLLQRKVPDGFEFRVTGQDGFTNYKRINRNSIKGEFDLEVSPNTAASNKQIQLSQAAEVLQITQNPLLLQTGIVTVGNLYEAVKNYLKIVGIKDYSRFISYQMEGQVILAPKEELDRLLMGEAVKVLPQGDHEGFIELVAAIFNNDEQMGQLDRQQVLILQAQVNAHQQMLQAVQQLQAQQANAQQMATNANIGTQVSQPLAELNPVGQNNAG